MAELTHASESGRRLQRVAVRPIGWLRRAIVGVALLLPIAGEAALRGGWPGSIALPLAGYGAALAVFAWLAPGSASDAAAPRARPARPILVPAALALFAAQVALTSAFGSRSTILAPLWLLGMLCWALAWLQRWRLPALTRSQWTALGLLLLVTVGLHFYDLDRQPTQVDELPFGLAAHYRTSDEPFGRAGISWFAHTMTDGYSHTALMNYPRLAVMRLFDISLTSLRSISALDGLLEVALVFFLGRQLFNYRVGLAAAATLATLAHHLNFSRHGAQFLEGSLVWTATGLLLARAFATRSVGWLALAGLAASFSFHMYRSARLVLALVVVAMVMAALDPRLRGRWLRSGTAALLGGFLVGLGPLAYLYATQPRMFLYHAETVGWLSTTIEAFQASGNPAALARIWEHLWWTVLSFNLLPTAHHNYLPGRGVFALLPAALFFAGLALVTVRLGDWRHRLLAAWFWGGAVGLGWLSDVPAAGHRMLPVLPAAAVLVGLAFDRLAGQWETLGAFARRLAAPVGAIALTLPMLYEVTFYFADYSLRDNVDGFGYQFVQYVAGSPPGRAIYYTAGIHPMTFTPEWATDLGRRNSVEVFGRIADDVPYLGNPSQGAAYLFHAERLFWLSALRDVYPDATVTSLPSPDPRLAEKPAPAVVELTPEQLRRHRGLQLEIVDATGRRREARVETLSVPADLDGLAYPIDVTWRGWVRPLRSPAGLPVSFRSVGDVAPRIRLDDAAVELSTGTPARLDLPPGGRPLHATARLASPSDTVSITWNGRDRTVEEPFPEAAATTLPGLPRVTVDWHTADGSQRVRRDYDVMIADWLYGLRAPSQSIDYLIKWSGELNAPETGSYEFQALGDGALRLFVDGTLVAANTTTVARVSLSAGPHAVVVERPPGGSNQAVLLWRRWRAGPEAGSAQLAVVPMSAFTPLQWP